MISFPTNPVDGETYSFEKWTWRWSDARQCWSLIAPMEIPQGSGDAGLEYGDNWYRLGNFLCFWDLVTNTSGAFTVQTMPDGISFDGVPRINLVARYDNSVGNRSAHIQESNTTSTQYRTITRNFGSNSNSGVSCHVIGYGKAGSTP